jgi:hypothetical protein
MSFYADSSFLFSSLDILHIAAAQTLASVEVVTFDTRQATLANRDGLRVAVL